MKEPIGSGPFKFVKEEWQPGNQVVYARNADYVPRSEPASGAAGGKHVYLDRVVWRYMPDSATAASRAGGGRARLLAVSAGRLRGAAGEEPEPSPRSWATRSDWSAGCGPTTCTRPSTTRRRGRPCCTWSTRRCTCRPRSASRKYYRTCPGIFFCGKVPYETAAGAPARQDLDAPAAHEGGRLRRPAGRRARSHRPARATRGRLVTRELLDEDRRQGGSAGRRLEYAAGPAREKASPSAGGWNLFSTNWISSDVIDPAVNAGVAGGGDRRLVRLVVERADGEDPPGLDPGHRPRPAQADRRADPGRRFRRGPVRAVGQYVQPSLYRKNVRGVLHFPAALLWNVWLDG